MSTFSSHPDLRSEPDQSYFGRLARSQRPSPAGSPNHPLEPTSSMTTRAVAKVLRDAIQRGYDKLVAAREKDATITPKHYYAATTKVLHFCFPGTFAIYDARVARSTEAWARAAYERRSDFQRFEWEQTYPTDGSGYSAIIDFYREFWQATAPAQHAALSENARRLASEIGANAGRLTEVDLIDCYLWMSSGAIFPS